MKLGFVGVGLLLLSCGCDSQESYIRETLTTASTFGKDIGATGVVCEKHFMNDADCSGVLGGKPVSFSCNRNTCWWVYP